MPPRKFIQIRGMICGISYYLAEFVSGISILIPDNGIQHNVKRL